MEIIQHYSVMEEGLRFSHLKKYTFFVIIALFWDPHHPLDHKYSLMKATQDIFGLKVQYILEI